MYNSCVVKRFKIYTKTGDSGTTSLFGGKRVDKNSFRIEAYGNVDELNSLIGIAVTDLEEAQSILGVKPLKRKLLRIQEELLVLGAELAKPVDVKLKIPKVTKTFISRLEKEIDVWSQRLTPLKKFILPGGGKIGAQLHLARATTRRTERSIVALSQQEKINDNAQIFINRLSDWLFVLARYVNKLENQKETIWKGRG